MNSLYLLINILSISVPLAASFEKRIHYFRKWRALFPAILLTAVFFLVWDVIFTRRGVWGFNPDYLTGLYLFSLPIEEWAFFITIPYASIFIFESIQTLLPPIPNHTAYRVFSSLLSLFLFALAFTFRSQAYTFWNFLFTGIFLQAIAIRNPPWMGTFYVAYLVHLIPFFIVNGVLTGSWIDQEVVWYNNEENLSIRIATIPIEDLIYALLLLLMNITFFEYFKTKIVIKTM